MKKILIALAAALTTAAYAAPQITVDLPIASYHVKGQVNPNGKPYNNSQLGTGLLVGARWASGNSDFGLKVGTYKNSYFAQSKLAAVDLGYHLTDKVRVGILLGAVSGYKGNQAFGKFGPFVAPQVDYSITDSIYTTVTYVPSNVKGGSSALAASVGYKF